MTDIRHFKYNLELGWRALFNDMGVTAQDVLRHAQLPLDLLTRRSPTVTEDEYFRLWEGLAHVLRDQPDFPLHMAQVISPETFSPAIFACLCSTNLNMALSRIAHYKPLVGPVRLELEQNEQYTRVTFAGLKPVSPLPTSMIGFELAFWVQVARMATREHIIPQAVHTTADPGTKERYEQFFGTAVQRGKFDGITFSAEDARKPFLTVNEAMWSIFEPELRKRLEHLTQDAPFRDRVRACLIEILASGQTSINDVALRLAISSRTLQRRLQAEDTNFQNVLDELREELARYYLTSSEYSSGQIAFLLGYEEPNSFYRAFRTWTGQTPEHIRRSIY